MNIQKVERGENLLKEIFYKDISSTDFEKQEKVNNKKSELKNKENHLDEENISKIKEKIENVAASLNFQIEFKQHKGTKKFYVEIIDKNTKKIIREIPPEQILDFLSKFEKMLGILFDRRT